MYLYFSLTTSPDRLTVDHTSPPFLVGSKGEKVIHPIVTLTAKDLTDLRAEMIRQVDQHFKNVSAATGTKINEEDGGTGRLVPPT